MTGAGIARAAPIREKRASARDEASVYAAATSWTCRRCVDLADAARPTVACGDAPRHVDAGRAGHDVARLPHGEARDARAAQARPDHARRVLIGDDAAGGAGRD